MKPMTKIILKDWMEGFSDLMAVELVKLIDAQGVNNGPEITQAIISHFLSSFTALTVLKCLGEKPSSGKGSEEEYQLASTRFLAHKILIQEAVAAAFSGALSEFTGRNVEYYCQIKLVPEPINDLVN